MPKGTSHLVDCPWRFVTALSHAMRILSYFKNLPKDEIPPKNIWLDDEKLTKWFKGIDKARKGEGAYKHKEVIEVG